MTSSLVGSEMCIRDRSDGVYAEIHKVSHQDMVFALDKDGIVGDHAGNQREGPMDVYQDGLLGQLVGIL
eukprot:2711182-Prorocentrum_lima.AAC.1